MILFFGVGMLRFFVIERSISIFYKQPVVFLPSTVQTFLFWGAKNAICFLVFDRSNVPFLSGKYAMLKINVFVSGIPFFIG